MLPHPAIAEIFKQDEALPRIGGKDFRCAKFILAQIFGHIKERLRIFVRGRRMH